MEGIGMILLTLLLAVEMAQLVLSLMCRRDASRRQKARQSETTRKDILRYGLYGVKPNGKTKKAK